MAGTWLKRTVNIALYGCIAGHFLLLSVYVLPHKPASNALTGFSDLYMSSFFHQEWDLFAPTPPTDHYEVGYVTLGELGAEQDTIWPLADQLHRHLNGTSITATKELYMLHRFAEQAATVPKDGFAQSKAAGFSMAALKRYCLVHARYAGISTPVELLIAENGIVVYPDTKSGPE